MPRAVVRLLTPTMTDAALAQALRARIPGATDLLLERYGPYMERLIVRSVGLDSEIPDLIHEAFTRVLEGIGRLRDGSTLKGWVGSVALFTARTFIRKRRARRRWLSVFSSDQVPELEAVVAPPGVGRTLERTYAILETLPTDERIAFALRVVDEMELGEIAQLTGVSLATAKRRIAGARRRFWERARRDPLLREHAPLDDDGEEP